MNSTSHLYKCLIQVANVAVVTTAQLQKIEIIKLKKTDLQEFKTKKEVATEADAINAFKKI